MKPRGGKRSNEPNRRSLEASTPSSPHPSGPLGRSFRCLYPDPSRPRRPHRPREPLAPMLGEGAPPPDISALRHAYGFDASLSQQYTNYWRGILHADLGQSLRLDDSVTHLILQRYPYTLVLTLAA